MNDCNCPEYFNVVVHGVSCYEDRIAQLTTDLATAQQEIADLTTRLETAKRERDEQKRLVKTYRQAAIDYDQSEERASTFKSRVTELEGELAEERKALTLGDKVTISPDFKYYEDHKGEVYAVWGLQKDRDTGEIDYTLGEKDGTWLIDGWGSGDLIKQAIAKGAG